MQITQNYLDQLEGNFLREMAQFVVKENYQHHEETKLLECENQSISKQINTIYEEELSYFNGSRFFVARDTTGSLKGSIRVLKWDYKTKLPLQKIFNINPRKAVNSNVTKIWHIGRFAVSKSNLDCFLFKKLMLHAVKPITKEKNAVAFAECDSKLLKVMKKMGIKVKVIGDAINYLGSETIPIYMDSIDLKGFYDLNKSLIEMSSYQDNNLAV